MQFVVSDHQWRRFCKYTFILTVPLVYEILYSGIRKKLLADLDWNNCVEETYVLFRTKRKGLSSLFIKLNFKSNKDTRKYHAPRVV